MPLTPAPIYQVPALPAETDLLEALLQACQQHQVPTAARTRLLLEALITDLRHITFRHQLTRAIDQHPQPGDPSDPTTILATFARAVLDAETRPPQPIRAHPSPENVPADLRETLAHHLDWAMYASPEDLPPDIRKALAYFLETNWERERDDHRDAEPGDRAKHPIHDLTALHHWLGRFSPLD